MVGNATEEAIIMDLSHPSHRDRPVWPLALALGAGILGVVLALGLGALGLPAWGTFLITAGALLALIAVVIILRRKSAGRPRAVDADRARIEREQREADLAVRIAAARACGDFDIWERRLEQG